MIQLNNTIYVCNVTIPQCIIQMDSYYRSTCFLLNCPLKPRIWLKDGWVCAYVSLSNYYHCVMAGRHFDHKRNR